MPLQMPARRGWFLLCGALAGCGLMAGTPAARAQAVLSGSVTDPDGEPVAGAVVTVRPLFDTALRIQVETDAAGRFRMENFNLSRAYRFHVAKEGYRTEMRDVEAGLQGRSRDGVLDQEFVLVPIGVNPTDREARLMVMTRSSAGVGPYQRGVRALERGDLDKARRQLEQARELDPDLAPAHEALALVYHRLGEYPEALAAADRALAIQPMDADYLRVRYEALIALGRLDEAQRTLDALARVAADRSTAVFFYQRAVEARQRGEFAIAEPLLTTALRLDPEMLAAKDALAKTYLELEKFESALALSAEVLEARPDDLQLLRLRHEAWSGLGRSAEARAALEDLVRHDPGPRTATLLYNLGVRHFNAGDLASAEEQFERALALDPDQLLALVGMAEVRFGQERYDECLALTARIEALSPGHPAPRRLAEWVGVRRDE